ncbi:MAG: DUF89 family protein [Thermoguttaceae bacterium]|nr:DUF89 family protein [Thermoguttaceae bacterium]
MPSAIDCYLCLLRQSLEAARFASNDLQTHRMVFLDCMRKILDSDALAPPPILGRDIHRIIRRVTGNPDPYLAEKRRANGSMLDQLEMARHRIVSSADPFDTAVRLAITGNIIDNALGTVAQKTIEQAFDNALCGPINGSTAALRSAIEASDQIFYLTDNAGEIVCDRLLIEQIIGLFGKKVIVAVRGKPIINDATYDDAVAAGLTTMENVEVIDNGNDGLGTFLEECSEPFLRHFTGDGLVISKGLANYETLVENTTRFQPKKIAFLFKSKCPFISHYAGTTLGDMVIRIHPEQ